MIVATRREDILRTNQVVYSTDLEEPLLPEEVRFPFEAAGRWMTQLRADCPVVDKEFSNFRDAHGGGKVTGKSSGSRKSRR